MTAGLLPVINPATGERFGECPAATIGDVDRAVAAAREAFDVGPWPRMSVHQRAAVLARVADLYVESKAPMAELITSQNGSPVRFTAQTDHPLAILNFYGALAGSYRWVDERSPRVEVHREPVGVVAVVVPWNMPQKTIMMKVAPALLAGCTVVIKPAPQTPLDAVKLGDIFAQADLPPGVVNVVTADSMIAEHLVSSPGVDKVAFTGSTATGARIAAICATRIGRVSLELGGKSAALVLRDADRDAVVASLPGDTFTLSGQICSAHTRLLVPYEAHDWYAQAIGALADKLVVGDPTSADTDLGPLVSEAQRDKVLAYIRTGLAEGAALVTGSPQRPDRPGWYVTPTVFANVTPDMTIAREEIFGPVVSVMPYDNVDQAVAIANGTRYGLEAAVWSADLPRANRIAGQLRAGTVRINGAQAPISSPLGGFKQSGIGRELGLEGLAGYLETKAIVTD